jgi:hypothetical protein
MREESLNFPDQFFFEEGKESDSKTYQEIDDKILNKSQNIPKHTALTPNSQSLVYYSQDNKSSYVLRNIAFQKSIASKETETPKFSSRDKEMAYSQIQSSSSDLLT